MDSQNSLIEKAKERWLYEYSFQEKWPDWGYRFKKDFSFSLSRRTNPDIYTGITPGTRVQLKDSWTGDWHQSQGEMDHWLGQKATILRNTGYTNGNGEALYRLEECPNWVFAESQFTSVYRKSTEKKVKPLPIIPTITGKNTQLSGKQEGEMDTYVR